MFESLFDILVNIDKYATYYPFFVYFLAFFLAVKSALDSLTRLFNF